MVRRNAAAGDPPPAPSPPAERPPAWPAARGRKTARLFGSISPKMIIISRRPTDSVPASAPRPVCSRRMPTTAAKAKYARFTTRFQNSTAVSRRSVSASSPAAIRCARCPRPASGVRAVANRTRPPRWLKRMPSRPTARTSPSARKHIESAGEGGGRKDEGEGRNQTDAGAFHERHPYPSAVLPVATSNS